MKRLILAAALFAVSTSAHSQSALEWAAQWMNYTNAASSYDRSGKVVSKSFANRLIRAEGHLAGVYGPLASKAREIESACGSRVISGLRHTRVAGSRRMSLHASGHAIDIAGNPGCIYARLRGFRGGYSIDYGRVLHVHISLGGGEDGARFAHYSSRRRYAFR